MRDLIILAAFYLIGLLLLGFGLYGLLQGRRERHKQKQGVLVSSEDMLAGWGKEEEEAKR